MINRKRVLSVEDPNFEFCWSLYNSAFPFEERRSLEYHKETMCRDEFHCDVIVEGETPIGILFWWSLRSFTYVEHLATTPKVRGRGYGELILKELIAESDKPILLEVEHPEDDLSRRRIGFYQRLGFVLNDHAYRHPSYSQVPGEFLSLRIMTHPSAIGEGELCEFMSSEFPIIHFRNF